MTTYRRLYLNSDVGRIRGRPAKACKSFCMEIERLDEEAKAERRGMDQTADSTPPV